MAVARTGEATTEATAEATADDTADHLTAALAEEMSEEIAVDWAYVRDTIRVNDALLAEIRAEAAFRGLSPTATLALVAREIVHDPGYVLTGLTGHPLVLVAETYRGNGGAVVADGATGPSGPSGAQGKSGQGLSGRPGGPGGNGGNGQPGLPASPVTVMAANLSDLRISARGGLGGAGGQGGTGGKGHHAAARPNKPDIDPPEPGPGGPGGNGGIGSVGGPGALILVETVTISGVATDGSGGGPGPAGVAGRGGPGGGRGGVASVAEPGRDGSPGSPGPGPGPTVQPVLVTHPPDNWWLLVKLRLGGRARTWADYRTGVGEYLFRAYAPAKPERGTHRDLAAHEFGRALALYPEQGRAAELLRYVASNLSPIGQPYDFDIMPDFPRFEGVVTDYDDIVKSLYDNALSLLLSAVDAGQKSSRLAADLAHVADMAGVLDLEGRAAALGLEGAKGKATAIDQQIEETRVQLDAVREKIVDKRMEFPPGNDLGPLLSAAIAVAAAVSAVYTGGASVVAFLAAANVMMTSVGAVEGFDVNTGKTADGDQLISYWDWKDPGNPQLKADKKDKIGGLAELVNTSKSFVDAGRSVADLFRTRIDGKLESQERDIIARQLDLVRQRGLQILEVSQKNMLLAAAVAKAAANKADLERLQNLKADWASDIAELGSISRRLVAQTQTYVDVLIRFGFYAHRALDLFTLASDTSPTYSFDIGYVHPDDVENAYQPLARGDDSRIIPLLKQYLDSWARMPELAALRSFYDGYQASLQHAPRYFTISDPAVLQSLRANGTATFTVRLDDFPADWAELKVERVHVALLGATADDPSVVAFLRHAGPATNRLRGGTVREISGQPLASAVEVTFDKREPGAPGPAGARPAFWGRSPATTWHVALEKTSQTQGNLRLDGLTALHIAIRYAFYAAPQATAQPVPPMPAGADFDGDHKADTVVWNSADGMWHVEPSAGGPAVTVPWGGPGDIPVPGDYDRDGRAELAVFRPSDRTLLTRSLAGGPTGVYLWRTEGYEPRPADYPGMDMLANAFRMRASDLSVAGRHDEAVAVQTQALDGYRQLTALSAPYRSALAQTLVMLGVYSTRGGRYDEGIAAGREGVAEYRTLGDAAQVAWAMGNLAALYRDARRYTEAVDEQRGTVEAYRELAAGDPRYRSSLAMTLVFLGMSLQQAGRHGESEAPSREAVALYRALGDEPNTAWALGNVGSRLRAAGRSAEAAEAWREAREMYRALAAADPVYRSLLAQSMYLTAVLLNDAGKRAEALAAVQESVVLYRQLTAENPGKYAGETAAAVKLQDSLAAAGGA
ncbi:tetratricopeptide repeat protein [Streptodolium elevatio]|uniref:Tetratricopeptide repeat protein n=1 Tax=Streptodolium elevatio TaxID=3157996 RepID=A0ABV3DHB1_9ACTN